MTLYYVATNMGYSGTDEILEIEADSLEEAQEWAWAEKSGEISVQAFETEEEAEENM